MIENGELCLSCGEDCIFHFIWRGRELDKRFYYFKLLFVCFKKIYCLFFLASK